MKNTSIIILLLITSPCFTQTIYTRPFVQTKVKWNSTSKDYDKDSLDTPFKTHNPKIILSFDEIKIIDGDTTCIFLNENPESVEDSLSIKRRWYNSNDSDGRECYVFLFFYPNDDEYGLRIVYIDDDTGLEYHMKPLRKDVIPYSGE